MKPAGAAVVLRWSIVSHAAPRSRSRVPDMTATTVNSLSRDARVISLVGIAHGLSHFCQLVLPPLFPFLRSEFEVSYAALGSVMALFYAVSGVCQFMAGFAVDRFGARKVLLAGVFVYGAAVLLCGLAPAFWVFFPLAVLLGIGNSVFHPADFSILNASVTPRRLGHAYSTHGIGGNLGWALAPVASFGLASAFGWRAALVILGAIGLGVFAMLYVNRSLLGARVQPAPPAQASTKRRFEILLQGPVLACFAFFSLLAMALVGVQTFGPTALNALHGIPLALATSSVTAYMAGGVAGILLGGFVAGWTARHDIVAGGGLVAAMLFMAMLATGIPAWAVMPLMAAAGFSIGVTNPSRDLIVRAATPAGASGRVYGFVYSGLDLGAFIAPLALGTFLDRGEPRLVFVAIAVCLLLTILTVVQVGRTRPGRSAPTRA
jgi:MFS family permease